MFAEFSDEHEYPFVVLIAPCSIDDVMRFAREVGAVTSDACKPGEPPDLVIDFRYLRDDQGQPIGPKVYKEVTVRAQLSKGYTPAS